MIIEGIFITNMNVITRHTKIEINDVPTSDLMISRETMSINKSIVTSMKNGKMTIKGLRNLGIFSTIQKHEMSRSHKLFDNYIMKEGMFDNYIMKKGKSVGQLNLGVGKSIMSI